LEISAREYNNHEKYYNSTASPTVLNPAMTGLFEGDLRLIGNYRSQWNNFTNGYKTVAGSVDAKLFPLSRTDFIGGGIQLYKDVAGDLDFTTTFGAISLSVLKALDARGTNFISFGMQGALMSNSVDYSKIVAFDNEPLILGGAPDRIQYADFSAGLGWFYAFNRYNTMYLGGALAHINEPKVSFFRDKNDNSEIFKYRSWTVHGGAEIFLTDNASLKPNFVFKDQGPHREILVGTFWKYKKLRSQLRRPATLYFGGWLRWYLENDVRGKDAFIFAIRLDYKQVFMTLSFDANISSLRRVSAGNGGPELSIIKIFDFGRDYRRSSQIQCPAFSY